MNEGWIDLQVNGYGGVDFNAPGLTVEKVLAVTEKLAADGTVGYLPTLVTGDPEVLIGVERIVMEARRKYPICEKNILGFFLEGPFISDKPGAVGTHPTNILRECLRASTRSVVHTHDLSRTDSSGIPRESALSARRHPLQSAWRSCRSASDLRRTSAVPSDMTMPLA